MDNQFAGQLTGKKIMILVANGVEQTAMSTIQRELIKTGASIKTVGLEPGLVSSWHDKGWGLYFPVDQQMSQTLGSDFDCIVVPNGSRAILNLAASAHSERILSSFMASCKPMVFMGDAADILEKTGHADWKKNPECAVMEAGAGLDASVRGMIAHFSSQVLVKEAA